MRSILVLFSLFLFLYAQSASGNRCIPGCNNAHCSCHGKGGKGKGPAYLIIDADTGCDDSAALLMTLGTGMFKILGVTTTFGNARIADTTRNALDLLQAYGYGEIPIYRGVGVTSSPTKLDVPDWIHGKNGIGDVELPPAKRVVEEQTAAEFIVEACDKYPGQVYLAFVGPLRNLADAIELDPDLPSKWKFLTIMGGAFHVSGNVSPYAEANFMGDYVAASKVFKYGKNIKAVGLDVTDKSPFTDKDLEEMSTANESAKLLTEIYALYQNFYNTDLSHIGGAPPHDAIAILGLIRPELFVWETGTISVVGENNERKGQSTIDTSDTTPNHQAAVSGDYLAIIEAVKSYITDPAETSVY